MLFRTVESPGLAHLSYLIADQGVAAVVDPRVDYQVYLDIAESQDLDILYILETHRNEDYVVGSRGLAIKTGAGIFHGSKLDFHYGNPASEGDMFEVGNLGIDVLETPGHTFESLSFAVLDTGYSRDEAICVFTGDSLFVGDVGRTDFFEDRREEAASLMYESVFGKLLGLGDQAVVFPGHGEGSICGSSPASREFSTIGYERKNNPVLQKDREEFVRFKASEKLYMPPYFRNVHEVNLKGPPIIEFLPVPRGLETDGFDSESASAVMVDVRSAEAFAGAHVRGSLSISLEMIPRFAGYLLEPHRDILLIAEGREDIRAAVTHLTRLGFLRISGYLSGGLFSWYTSGRDYLHVPTIGVEELVDWILDERDFTLLDVRSRQEYEESHLPGAVNIYLGELPARMDEVPERRPLVTFCGSGKRAIIAASVLLSRGYSDILNCFGSMSACSALGCPLDAME
jgi:hydroxyacylglutathione hydrolase